jgi:hypothetical protein
MRSVFRVRCVAVLQIMPCGFVCFFALMFGAYLQRMEKKQHMTALVADDARARTQFLQAELEESREQVSCLLLFASPLLLRAVFRPRFDPHAAPVPLLYEI